MIRANIKISSDGDEKTISIDLPKTLKEVPLNRFIDFIVECRAMSQEGVNQVAVMAKAISAFTDYPLAEIIQARVGDSETAGLNETLLGVFGYISNLIGGAKPTLIGPQDALMEYQGEKYRIPVIIQQALNGTAKLPSLSVIEVIEVAELQRLKAQHVKAKGDPTGFIRKQIMNAAQMEVDGYPQGHPVQQQVLQAAEMVVEAETEKLGDPDGSLMFSMFLRTVAILCRKDGEKMPFNDGEREQWIDERTRHFMRLDTQTALNVDFFLANILGNSKNPPIAAGFLTRQLFAVVAVTRLKSGKRLTALNTIMSRFLPA